MYALARTYASVLPTTFSDKDLFRSSVDIRVTRCVSLLVFNIVIFVPEIVGAGIVGYIVPFVISGMIVLRK